MANDNGGIGDSVGVHINGSGEAAASNPDAKGPDPVQWDDPGARVEDEFDPGEGQVKGPDPAQWPSDVPSDEG